MENKSYTIKDIARLAGVSAGTVDRVLHNRGDVSRSSLEKVQKVLDAIDYHPNMFAIGLAAKKRYRFLCITPYYIEHDYWHSVNQGIERAAQELRPFNVAVDYLHYHHGVEASYEEACLRVCQEAPDAVLIAPNFEEQTLRLTARLDETAVPYTFIDFNVRRANPLCYIGQDSWISGYVAAKILMRGYEPGQELVLFLSNRKNNPAEIQMRRRLEGFMKRLAEENPGIPVHDVLLRKEDEAANREILEDFFVRHPQPMVGVVFNSRIYQVAGYLHETGRRMAGLLGYDLLHRNVAYLKSGEISCLIGQRPRWQGYCGVKALCNHVVFKKPVTPVCHTPIDILIKENIDFYFEIE